MTRVQPWLLFDSQDFELVDLVNEFMTMGKKKNPEQLRKLFDPALHPRGIKELAESQQRRIAYAVIHLIDSLEAGDARERIIALRCLRDEVLSSGRGSMPRNTARVLIEIMKKLVRTRGDYWRQVELAHDFFAAVSGRPVEIRQQLRRYHLVEMSEAWNQVAFDHHVHDANTKGRKAPTHLIMDAWIKGIRELTVVYYNYATREAIAELIEAAEIMGIEVRAGIEVAARFRGKYVYFIWEPHGFAGPTDFLSFLEEPEIRRFFDQGREVAQIEQRYVLALLHRFNEQHLSQLNKRSQLAVAPLAESEFLEYVGVGQPSVAHLADFIHHQSLDSIELRMELLCEQHRQAHPEEQKRIEKEVEWLNGMLPELIIDDYLSRSHNPDIPDPKIPNDKEDPPELRQLSPAQLLTRLKKLRPGSRVTLNPSNLSPADVLELIYEGRGLITHLEVFNLKDHRRKKDHFTASIGRLRRVINGRNPIACKHLIQDLMGEIKKSEDPQREDRLTSLQAILGDMQTLLSFYAKTPLQSRIGSDSIGRSRALFGMGLAVTDTLLPRARREFRRYPGTKETIPVRTEAALHTVWKPKSSPIHILELMFRGLRRLPGLREFGYDREESYVILPNVTRVEQPGNIITLGGLEEHPSNELTLAGQGASHQTSFRWRYLNSPLKNVLKVLIGFIPAFLTFYLTKDWWVLAYLGAVIWFSITGLRNIVQSIMGGGGLRRSKLLRWNDLISWERVADSLLFTGFSVPLLDFLVKSLLLDRWLSVTTTTAPMILYSAMALANGIYLFTHNTFRGLPQAAAFGNFFRSVLSIPIAIGINAGLLALLQHQGMSAAEANAMLQKWAAIIGKFSSDLVAGFIEGTADRNTNIRTRFRDYRVKLTLLLDVHGRLETLFPERNVTELLKSPKEFFSTVGKEARDLEVKQIIHALDMMYFWMLQPRARVAFRKLIETTRPEERAIILQTQRLLERQRPISKMFLDNLVGKRFSAPLAFYLDKSPVYLRDMQRLAEKMKAAPLATRPGD